MTLHSFFVALIWLIAMQGRCPNVYAKVGQYIYD